VPDAFGVTDTVPLAVVVERFKLLPVIVSEVAFAVFQLKVEEEPRAIVDEEKIKEETVGSDALAVVPEAIEDEATLPTLSWAATR
jgi:tRNA A37 methylthiotransferase MiaB